MGKDSLCEGLVLGLLCCGCVGPEVAVGPGGRAPASLIDPSTTTATSTATTGDASSSLEGGVSSGPGAAESHGAFLVPPDFGNAEYACSLWLQDCAEGEKCTVWAPDGVSLDGTRCVSVVAEPDLEDEPCRGERGTGEDTCEAGTFCWDMDPETQLGLCIGFCEGSDAAPLCRDPAKTCNFNKQFAACLADCEPLLNDCPAGCGCYPMDSRGFQCVPDLSEDGGGYLEPCEFRNDCEPGLACLRGDWMPCEGEASSCCGLFCALSDPQCPDGLTCVPALAEGAGLPLHEDVGYCMLADMSDSPDAEPGRGTVVP